MCCCDVTSCCCGCNNLQKGTFIWAIVDAIFNLVLFIGTAAPLGGASPTWFCFGMFFWDILVTISTTYFYGDCSIQIDQFINLKNTLAQLSFKGPWENISALWQRLLLQINYTLSTPTLSASISLMQGWFSNSSV